MKKDELILKLETWLSKDGNSKLILASKLGYKSSNTIQMWLYRGSIPEWQRYRVDQIISSKGVKK